MTRENGYANHAFKPDDHDDLNDRKPREDSMDTDKHMKSENNDVNNEKIDKEIIKNGGPKYKDKRHLNAKVNIFKNKQVCL